MTTLPEMTTTMDSPGQGGVNGATVILGLGATGLSCARHLAAEGSSLQIFDSRENPPCLDKLRDLAPEAVVHTGTLDVELPSDTARVVVSPGLPLDLPILVRARERGLPVIGDIELFARIAQHPIAAVTGSNGKSTVATMLASMAQQAGKKVLAGGNLGIPALDLLEAGPVDLYVLELSSFQLESTQSLRAEAAVVLNVSADHIDRHGSLSCYAKAKSVIYRGAHHVVANRDDVLVMSMLKDRNDVTTFGLDAAAAGQFGVEDDPDSARQWLCRGPDRLLSADKLRVAGSHNIANALAAIALGTALGLPDEAMFEALHGYRGLAHRTSVVAELGGISWIDDSKATNVGASVAAINGLGDRLVLIAGGDGKGVDFTPLAKAAEGRVHAAVLIGADALRLEATLFGVCPTVLAPDMKQAVLEARRLARSGDTVLLSPACASLDMYTDYAARGEAFARAVRELDS
jgi:UDP-N-acetylmuramoylalanine--D-glutamate ligase